MEVGQRQVGGVLLLLQRLQTGPCLQAQLFKIQAELRRPCVVQAPQTLPEQHRGSAAVPALEVEVGHGDLQDPLQPFAAGTLGFMPAPLKAVLNGVPLPGTEKPDRLP